MTASAFSTLVAWSYGVALAGYAAFAARLLLGYRASARARRLLAALAGTTVWAVLCVLVGLVPTAATLFGSNLADALRYAAWFAFLASLLREVPGALVGGTGSARARMPGRTAVVIAAILVAGVLLGEGSPLAAFAWWPDPRVGYLMRLGVPVFGLVMIEQVVRRIPPQMRWGIRPLAVALAGVFGLDLYFYADAMLFGRLDPIIWATRGFANAIVIPFLAVATARNTGWTVDLHLSRRAVFHSSALLLSGAFLLLVAGAGYLVRYFGGEWGRAVQIELLFAATLFVVLVATSGRFRSKLKVFVSKHFFSYRYDYREEWLRFTGTLSMDGASQGVQERTITALADLVESPGGTLLLRNDSGRYVPAARGNAPLPDASERADGELATFLARTGWIVHIGEWREHPERYQGLTMPAWLEAIPAAWIVVPLQSGSELLGMAVLTTPRTPVDLDWEVRDLLKTASRQAASYLAQMRMTEALLEARKFEAFNRMSAFVVHDLKNLVAQQSLMLKNAQRHRGNPEFQADMLATVEHVVSRMNRLMLQLRVGSAPVDSPRPVDLEAVVRRICSAKSDTRTSIALDLAPGIVVLGHEDRLEHVFGHLIQNAIDASAPTPQVTARLSREAGHAVLEVRDNGVGMTPEFVRERLFKPFQTTKPTGMGIGVYESSQYVAGLGGGIAIESEPGVGTRVFVRLPLVQATAEAHEDPAAPAAPAAPIGEAAA